MTRSSFAVLIVGVSVGITGCMPMEQAPLVYSSKQQMGVGVTAGTPESPGLDVNIGYKGLDAAFVPVIVAKHCDRANGADCAGIDYNAQPVLGRHDVSSETKSDRDRLKDIEEQLAGALVAFGDNRATLDRKRAELRAVNSRATAKSRFDELTAQQTAGVTALSTDQTDQLAAAADRVATADALIRAKPQAARETELRDLTIADRQLGSSVGDLRTRQRQLEAALSAKSGNTKLDALSVFGSFDGSAGGNKDGANLGVGKVFSTGVAAQNMSSGVGNAAFAVAMGKCLAEAGKLLGNSQDDKLRKEALTKCQVTSELAPPTGS